MANDIALQVQPIKLDNPVQQYANVLALQGAQNQNRLADFQYKTGQESYARQNALRNALGAAGGDKTAYRNALAQFGTPEQVAAYSKAELEGSDTQSKIDERQVKILKEKLGIFGGAMTPFLQNPTRQGIISTMQALEANGIKPPPIPLPEDDSQLGAWVRQTLAMTEDGMKRLDAVAPKPMLAGGAVIQSNSQAPGFMGKLGDVAPTVGDQLRGANEPFRADGTPNVPVQQFQIGKSRAGASSTNVSVNTGDKKYAEVRGAKRAEAMDDLEKAAQSAAQANDALDRFIEASKTSTQGGAQPIITGVQNFLSSFGYKGEDLKDVRVMEQAIGDILQNKMAELGARGLTDRDMDILRQALPRVATDRTARAEVARIVKTANLAKIDEYARQREEEARIYPEISSRVPEPEWYRRHKAKSPNQPKPAPKPGAVQDGYRFKGGNAADPNNWEKM
jgi:hypothetical protein